MNHRRQLPCRAGADHRQPNVQLTLRQRRSLRALAAEGKTQRWLASHFGISVPKVRAAIGKRKTQARPTSSPPVELAAVTG